MRGYVNATAHRHLPLAVTGGWSN